MIKAEWTNKDSLDLQQTCNKLAITEGDLISRAGAIECIRWGESVTDVIDRINALPSADAVSREEVTEIKNNYINEISMLLNKIDALSAEPKTGEWIDKGNWMGIECSRCKCHSRYVTPFCPQCGSRMLRKR